jgi:hypothetical protein
VRDAVELRLYSLIDLGMGVPMEICPDR